MMLKVTDPSVPTVYSTEKSPPVKSSNVNSTVDRMPYTIARSWLSVTLGPRSYTSTTELATLPVVMASAGVVLVDPSVPVTVAVKPGPTTFPPVKPPPWDAVTIVFRRVPMSPTWSSSNTTLIRTNPSVQFVCCTVKSSLPRSSNVDSTSKRIWSTMVWIWSGVVPVPNR